MIIFSRKKYWNYDFSILSNNENFRSTILQSFRCEPEQKKTCGEEGQEEETKHFHVQLRSNCWRCSMKKVFLGLQLY